MWDNILETLTPSAKSNKKKRKHSQMEDNTNFQHPTKKPKIESSASSFTESFVTPIKKLWSSIWYNKLDEDVTTELSSISIQSSDEEENTFAIHPIFSKVDNHQNGIEYSPYIAQNTNRKTTMVTADKIDKRNIEDVIKESWSPKTSTAHRWLSDYKQQVIKEIGDDFVNESNSDSYEEQSKFTSWLEHDRIQRRKLNQKYEQFSSFQSPYLNLYSIDNIPRTIDQSLIENEKAEMEYNQREAEKLVAQHRDRANKHKEEYLLPYLRTLEARKKPAVVVEECILLSSSSEESVSESEEEYDFSTYNAKPTYSHSGKGYISIEEEIEILKCCVGRNENQIMSDIGQAVATKRDLNLLLYDEWLNDEIVNFYMHLIHNRYKEKQDIPSYCFTSYFYMKLTENGIYDYSKVSRWTAKIGVDIFEYDYIFIPIHLPAHWVLGVINFKDQRFEYYDSMNGNPRKHLAVLRRYVRDEHMDKKGSNFDLTGWTNYQPRVPQQNNGYDCGVFTCQYAEHISRGSPIDFVQRDMPYFRKRMIMEIVNKSLS
eukprot:TRINITY_DN12196_c0_g1_i1.p1 TRINITY_DN12196_c0_g1~~TRINITY_DN12196_c0_g1_i1.p1  ORF type:complete len:542 (-),score=110.11 TRINITY_DN12196_c0_g1_i1:23-1648(-)